MSDAGIHSAVYARTPAYSSAVKPAANFENQPSRQDALAPSERSSESSAESRRDSVADISATDKSQTEQQTRKDRLAQKQQELQQQQDQQQIRILAARDREVRAHEQAHAAVGGQHAGATDYTFERGPDGVNYAIGGEVPINLPGGTKADPEAVLAAANQVRRAALAPADPSAQDRSVAAQASQIAAEARIELVVQQQQEQIARSQADAVADQAGNVTGAAPSNVQGDYASNDDSRSISRRSEQLNSQLITGENILRNQSVGSLIDRHA
ncbi:MAG: putative metalloprotease CJM1_0395 family protein [Spongiibacteraceae bacterium]